MFIGHYAASVAVKIWRPQLPFWACVGAAQLLDIGWGVLIIAGVERLRLDPALPGSPLVLEHMPYTHSLPAALLWSALAAVVAVRWLGRRGAWLGLVVLSHWLLDFIVHRPDLPLGFLGPKVGLGLWNLPAAELIVELGLIGLAMAWWAGRRGQKRLRLRPVLGWFLAMLVLAVINVLPGEPPTPAGMGGLALLAYGLAILLALPVDRADRSARVQSI